MIDKYIKSVVDHNVKIKHAKREIVKMWYYDLKSFIDNFKPFINNYEPSKNNLNHGPSKFRLETICK